jgi:hypothetical protein
MLYSPRDPRSLIEISQPTVKFYGKKDNRHVTVLEGEPADLPLRLTGEGVGFFPSHAHS